MRTSNSVAPIPPGEPSPLLAHSHSVSIQDEESLHHDSYDYSTHDEDNWADEDDISESETSTSYGAAPPPPRAHSARLPLRPPPPQQHQYRSVRRVPNPVPSVDPPEEYGSYGPGYSGGQFGRGGFPRGAPQHPQGYGGYYPQGQMVGYHQTNPFTPISSPSSNASYYADPRGGYGNEMVQFPGQYYHPGYPQQFQMAPPAVQHDAPAATEASAREKELQAKVAAFEKEREKQELAERQKEIEAEANRKAAEETKKYMEEMERLREQNKVEIARARADAERTARENIETERKAAEERARVQEEAVKQAEERVRIQFEAQMRAVEARKKKDEEDRIKADEAAKARLEKALRADAEMKEAMAKKAAEEAERLKQIQEDAKRKADTEMAAKIEAEREAAAKKAEADAQDARDREAFKKKIEDETKAALEEKAKKDRGPYLQFKDALGRKYSFPYRLCTTWPNMEELIRQAFENVDELAPHIQEGWYDLIGPSGEIILPSVWEKVVEPEWSITMTMWPSERIRSFAFAGRYPGMGPGMGRGHGMPPVPPVAPRGGRPVSGVPGGMHPPPGWANAHGGKRPNGLPPGIQSVANEKKDKKKKQNTAFGSFFGGKPPTTKKKSSKK